MKKQIYIHIGIGKTGTSSIRKLLQINKFELSKYGIFYPNTVENFSLAING
jgi:hypothetical protein